MAKVPDLGSDFAQKLLKDLRRRRERLGFASAPEPAKRGAANAAAPRDAYSKSQKPLQVQKPKQAAPAPRVGRSEATTSRLSRHGNSSIAGPGKPRRHDAPAVSQSHAIVPFQGGSGGGGSNQTTAATNASVDMQMALALALSNSGKLQLVARQGTTGGSMFFGEPDRTTQARHLLTPGAPVGKVAIGVQKLNDILMAYSSGGVRRGSVEIGKQLLRGAMDLEESLSMLMMLQDASDYMGNSGNGKVLMLEGDNENWKSSMPRSTSSASARLVEIFDDYSEAEKGDNAKSPSDAFMQIVPHSLSQNYRSNQSSPLQLATVTNNSKSNAASVDKDDSKVRMPSLIAKLMGLDNLPSAKPVMERKGTERFVKPEAVPRRATAKNAMVGTLPIRIIASERVPSKGQIKNFQTREWDISLTKSEEPVLSNRFSHLMADKQTRQTMKQVLSRQEGTERKASLSQVVDDKIVHQDMKLAEVSNQQKKTAISAGKKMNFLQRLKKNAKNKPVTEEKDIVQENKQKLGKKQTSSIKQRDSEVKPRWTIEKFNKENLATPENKAQGKNGKTVDKMRRQPQSKPIDKHIMEKKVQNYSRTQSETASQNYRRTQTETASQNYRRTRTETATQNLEHKRSMKSEATHAKKKFEYITMIELKNGEDTKVDDTGAHKLLDNTPGDDGVFKQSAEEMKDSSTTSGISPDQSEKQFSEEIIDPITTVEQTTADSIAEANDDGVEHTSSETTQILETFSQGELQEQQLQQMKEVHDQSRNGLDHIIKPDNLTDSAHHKMNVVSCDSFTENQLLLTEMLLKDPYLLETAKAITGFHVPISDIHVTTGKWLDKGNKILSDVGREVIRRKGKRTEAMDDVSMRCAANLKLQTLNDLIRELDSDIQSLNIPKKPHQQSENSTAENLKMVLYSDIEITHSDANSVWDFGWNRIRDLPIEKNEVVKDLEKNILGGIITDVARELIDVSLRHASCACEA